MSDNGTITEPGDGSGLSTADVVERQVTSVSGILQSPPDCREELFEVPEWGGWVKLRSPTALASAAIKEAAMKFDDSGTVVGMDLRAMEREQMRYGVVEPALTLEDVAEMQRRFGPSWNRVMAKLDELTGPLGKGATREDEFMKERENTFR
jgi:hypothetical protein